MKVVTSWRTDSWTRGTIQGKMDHWQENQNDE